MSIADQPNELDDLLNLVQSNTPSELQQQIEQLALFLARSWQEEHADCAAEPDAKYQACIAYVTQELAVAAAAVGGAAGLEILTGGGSRAARTVCQLLFAPLGKV